MKHNWEYKPFKQLANILYGCPFESDYFNSESKGMPLIRIRDVKPGFTSTFFDGDYSDEYIIKKGEYLIGMDGEFNIALWKSENALLNQRVCRVKSSNEEILSTDFIFYFLGQELKRIEEKTPFVTVKHLSAKVLNSISTPVPHKKIQEQIVAELDKINEVIADCRELLRNLDALAQSLFYDYFGDPVTNPKGWKVNKVSDNFETGSGGTPSKSISEFWNSDDIPWIGSNMCQNEILHNTDGKFISNLGLENSSAKLLYPDTLLVALVGATIGKVALLKIPTSTNQNIGFIKPNKDIANPIFLFYTLQGLYPLFLGIGNGKFKMANLSFIRDLPIILPPLELQEKFAERIEQIETQKKAVEETIANLQVLLDSRMDYWFN